MDFGSFLAAPEIKVKVVTYRDIFQDKAMIENRFGDEYQESFSNNKIRFCRSQAIKCKKRWHCHPEKLFWEGCS